MRHALEETTLLKQPNRDREMIEKKIFPKNGSIICLTNFRGGRRWF
jgi:hypothetical protein